MSDNGNGDVPPHQIEVSIGGMHIFVQGEEPERVKDDFEDVYERVLDDAGEMKEAVRRLDRSTQ